MNILWFSAFQSLKLEELGYKGGVFMCANPVTQDLDTVGTPEGTAFLKQDTDFARRHLLHIIGMFGKIRIIVDYTVNIQWFLLQAAFIVTYTCICKLFLVTWGTKNSSFLHQ